VTAKGEYCLSCGQGKRRIRMLPNPTRGQYHRPWPVGQPFVQIVLLVLIVTNSSFMSEVSAQELRPSPIEFTNVTAPRVSSLCTSKGITASRSIAKSLVRESASPISMGTASTRYADRQPTHYYERKVLAVHHLTDQSALFGAETESDRKSGGLASL